MIDPTQQKKDHDATIQRLRENPAIDALMGENLEQLEAESYLANGGKHRPDGFDLRDSQVRKDLVERPANEFIDFQVNPIPEEVASAIRELPGDWQENPECYDRAERICQEAERVLMLPKHLYASLNERKELWVRLDEEA